MSLRDMISSPLEAGTSILDSHTLPPTLRPAFEYASSRLAKKSLHLTLVVVRRDYQLPPLALTSPTGYIQDFGVSAATPTTPGSPPLSASSTSSRFTRHISRWTSRVPGSPRSIISSPAFTPLSATFPGPKPAWPPTPGLPMSPPPMTPGTASSSIATDGGLSSYGCDNGLRFLYSEHLPVRVERMLHHILIKAARKFRIPSMAAPIKAVGLINHLVNASVMQNETLFASDGLQLVSIDRLYSLKCALSSYTKTRSPLRLEDAVDDLRRCVLANGRRQVSRSDLLRSYDWMSVSDLAVFDLDYLYRRAYGGIEGIGGISGMPEPDAISETPGSMVHTYSDTDSTLYESSIEEDAIMVAYTAQMPVARRTPSPRVPVLKIQTSFDVVPKLLTEEQDTQTARPSAVACEQPWNIGNSIDQILSTGENLTSVLRIVNELPETQAMTGYDDISPITRGEWGFLMSTRDDGKRGAVERWN